MCLRLRALCKTPSHDGADHIHVAARERCLTLQNTSATVPSTRHHICSRTLVRSETQRLERLQVRTAPTSFCQICLFAILSALLWRGTGGQCRCRCWRRCWSWSTCFLPHQKTTPSYERAAGRETCTLSILGHCKHACVLSQTRRLALSRRHSLPICDVSPLSSSTASFSPPCFHNCHPTLL